MKKILHVIPSLGLGGTEKILLTLSRSLGADFSQSVVALKSGGPTAQALEREGIAVSLLNSPDGFSSGVLDMPRLFFTLRGIIQREKPDIVHSWLSRANVIARLAAWGSGAPVISSLRVMEVQKGYHLWMERATQSLCRAVTVNSSSLRDFAREQIGIRPEKLRLIFNGIEVPPRWDAQASAHFRAQWSAEGEFVVGTIGRLHWQKGHDIFLRAAAIVAKQKPHAKFLIVGDGPERARLQALIAQLGLQKNAALCGWVEQPLTALAAFDVFAFCSRWEGMPNTVLEAMALEKPVACSAFAGVRDLLENRKQALIFPIENPQACAEAILELFNNPALAEQCSSAAFERARAEFSLNSMLDAYRKLYHEL